MTIQELMARVGGQVLANKARATVGGQSVVIGVFEGTELVFTEAGKALADRESNITDVEVKEPAVKTPRKAKAAAVESTPAEPEIDLGTE
jgi:hypothetical protein